MIWLRKFGAIVLLSLAVALAFLPWPSEIHGEHSVEYVRLEAQEAPFTEQTARAEFGEIVSLDYEGLEAFPDVLDTFLRLQGESDSYCIMADEWLGMLSERGVADPDGTVFAFRDNLHRFVELEVDDVEGIQMCYEATLLGAYDNADWSPMTRLGAEALADYPELAAEMARLAAGPLPSTGGREVPAGQWHRFHGRELANEWQPRFVALDRLFSGSVDHETEPWTLQTPWLRQIALGLAAVAGLYGLFLLVVAYRLVAGRSGIPTAPAWLAVFCDVISLAGGVFLVGLAVDTLWVGPLGQHSLLGLTTDVGWTTNITGLHFISVPGVLLVLPGLTLWFASLSSQRIAVDGEGVTARGALMSTTLRWQDLQRVELREQRNPFAFTVVDFRSLQTVLDLESEDDAITINEPASAARKQQILSALRTHAPDDKRPLFDRAAAAW